MSVSYKLIGKRWLRKYTASKATPVYAAEADVNRIVNELCDVPWKRVSPKNACMTYHTDKIVVYTDAEKKNGITGLDYNVQIRDEFDAALFCSHHVSETHVAHANAACYKFVLPDMGSYPTLESLAVRVTSDPYNSVGARIAVFTNSTGIIPTACNQCRQGSAPSAAHSCTHVGNDWTTNDTYADAVAPRDARSSGSGSSATTNWYPVSGTCTFAPTGGLQLQKYLYVFVLMENYNTVRGNWIEGCSFIENSISLTTSSAVSGWTSGDTIDLSSAESVTSGAATPSFPIISSKVVPDISGAVSPVVTASVLSSGTDVRKLESGAVEDLSQVRDEITSANVSAGIVTLYGKFHTGDVDAGELSCCCPKYKTFGVGFCVTHGNGETLRDEAGKTANPMSLNLTASSLMVPFGIPTGFEPATIKFDWSSWLRSSAPSAGARFNFWIKQDEFVGEYPSVALKNHALYDASESSVAGWRLLGTESAAAGSVSYSIAEQCPTALEGVATILITAYIPADRIPSIVDRFQRGTNAMWYDSNTPDDLVSVLDTYQIFSEASQYEVGDTVQFGTNEAEKWTVCKSTAGSAFSRVATNGYRWVAASSSGLWYSYGADSWKKSNVTTVVDDVAYFGPYVGTAGGVFVAYRGSTLYVNTDLLGEQWSTIAVPYPIVSLSKSGYSYVVVGTTNGAYRVNSSNLTVSAFGASGGSVNGIGILPDRTSYYHYSGSPVVAADRGLYYANSAGTGLVKSSVVGPFSNICEICVASSSSLLALSNYGVFHASSPAAWTHADGMTASAKSARYYGGSFVVATEAGVYRYSAGTGCQVVDSLPVKDYSKVIVADGTLFVAGSDGTVYRSTDTVSWIKVLEVAGLVVREIAAGDGWMILGAASSGGASNWLSEDHGVTWVENGGLLLSGRSADPTITQYMGTVNGHVTAKGRTFVLTDRSLWLQTDGSASGSVTMRYFRPQFVDTFLSQSGINGQGTTDSTALGPWYCVENVSSVPDFAGTYFAGSANGLFKLTPDSDTAGTTREYPLWKQDSSYSMTGAVYRVIPASASGTDTVFLVAQNGFFRYLGTSSAVEKVYPYQAIFQGDTIGTAYAYSFQCPDCLFVVDRWYYEGSILRYTGRAPYQNVDYHDYVSAASSYIDISNPGFHELSVSGGNVVYKDPVTGLDATLTVAWSCPSGSSADKKNWVAAVSGTNVESCTLTTYLGTDDPSGKFPFDQSLGGIKYTNSSNSLNFTLWLKLGDLQPENAGPAIAAAYAYYPHFKRTGTITSFTFYDISGHGTEVTTSTEDGKKVLSIEYGKALWTNLSSTLNRTAFGGKIPDFSMVQWTGTKLVLPVAGSRKVYESSDFGYNWTASEDVSEYGAFLHVCGNGTGGTLVAANEDGYAFVSTDRAGSWRKVFEFGSAPDGMAFANGRWYAWTGTELFVTATGTAWTKAEAAPVGVRDVAYMHGRYVLSTDYGIYWSADGTTWTKSDFDDLTNSVGVLTDRMFAATEGGIAYSGDKVLLNEETVSGQLVPGFNKIICVGSAWIGCGYAGSGLFYSPDGDNWKQSNIENGTFYDACATASAVYAVGPNGIYKSTDSGAYWTKESGVSGMFSGIRYDSTTGKVIAYGTGVLYVLSGSTWTSAFPAFTGFRGNGSGTYVACSPVGVFYSTDCRTWRPVASFYGSAATDLRYDEWIGKWSVKTSAGWYSSSNATTWTARSTPTGVVFADFCPSTVASTSVDCGYSGSTAYVFYGGSWQSATPEVGTILGLARYPNYEFFIAGTSGVKHFNLGTHAWDAVTGIIGTPKKILSCGKASSSASCFVMVLTEEGKVFVNRKYGNAGYTAFYDVTPAGATVSNLVCESRVDGWSNWFAVTDLGTYFTSNPSYDSDEGGPANRWLLTLDAPSGLTAVFESNRNVTGYGFADGSLYLLDIVRVSGVYQPVWSRIIVKTDLSYLCAGGSAISDPCYLPGSDGRIYSLDDDDKLSLVFSGGGTTFKGAAMDGSGNCIAVGPKGVTYKSANSGSTWTFADRGASVDLADVAYYPKTSKWLTVGSGGIQYSSDGSAWTAVSGVSAARTRLCVGAESVVACGTGGISASTDGVSWSTSTFSGVTTLDAAYTSADRWSEVAGISDTFKNIEWDSTNSRFIATSLRYKYISTDRGETWSVNPWETDKVVELGTSSSQYIPDSRGYYAYYYLHLHDGRLYPFRASSGYFSYLDALSPTGVVGVQSFKSYLVNYKDESGSATSFTQSCMAYVSAVFTKSNGGVGLVCRDPYYYTMSFPDVSTDQTVTSSYCGGSLKVVDGEVYYQLTGSETWTKISNWALAGCAFSAKCEGNRLYWKSPTGSWTLLASGPTSVNACYTYVRVDGTYAYKDISTGEWHYLSDSGLLNALKMTDIGTVLGVVGMSRYYTQVIPAVVTTKGIFIPASGNYLDSSLTGCWALFEFRDAMIATSNTTRSTSASVAGAMLKYENGSHYQSANAGSRYAIVNWTDITSQITITGTIRSLGYVDSLFTYVTDTGYTTYNKTTGATVTTNFPETLPAYVQDPTSGIKLKVSGTKLMVSAAYGWVAVGYEVVSAGLSSKTDPVLLTATGSTWMKNSTALGTLSSNAASTRALSVANGEGTWIASCELGIASGGLDSTEPWLSKFNSNLVPLVGMYEDGSYRFACLQGIGAVVSLDKGVTWYPSILAYGTVKNIAMYGNVRVAAGSFGLRVAANKFLSNRSLPYHVRDAFAWAWTYGDDVFENATFEDVAVYDGTFIASGSSGIYRTTAADPLNWTRVATGSCGKIIRSELCWIVLTAGGVYRSEDTLNWTKVRIGTNPNRLRELAVSADGVFVIAGSEQTLDNGTQDVYYSSDGVTWTAGSIALTDPLDSTNFGYMSSLTACNGYVFMSRSKIENVGVGGLWASSDRGATWTSVEATAGLDLNRVEWSDVDQVLYAGGRDGIFFSADGIVWSRLTAGYWTASATIRCIASVTGGTVISVDPVTAFSYSGNNMYVTSCLGYPIRKAYRCVERVKVPGLFDPSKWEEVESPSRSRLTGIRSLCIPDITLYS